MKECEQYRDSAIIPGTCHDCERTKARHVKLPIQYMPMPKHTDTQDIPSSWVPWLTCCSHCFLIAAYAISSRRSGRTRSPGTAPASG